MKRAWQVTTIICIILFFNLKTNRLPAQTWADVGGGCYIGNLFASYNDTANNLLYVGGYFDSCDDNLPTRGFAYWNGAEWTDMAGTQGSDYTTSIIGFNGAIYHGVKSGNLYMGYQSNKDKIVGTDAAIRCMAVYHNQLYLGGEFTHIKTGADSGLVVNGITFWDSTHWHTCGTGIKITAKKTPGEPAPSKKVQAVWAMCVFNDTLYIGGRFDSANGVSCHNLAKWDGTNLTIVPEGVTASTGPSVVKGLSSYAGQLLIGGVFTTAGDNDSVSNFATWNGAKNWGNLNIKFDKEVDCFRAFAGKLYVGGYFDFQTSPNCIASYDGSAWSSLNNGVQKGLRVLSLTPYNGTLMVCGKFTKVDGVPVENIASWTPVFPKENFSFGQSSGCTVFPNPATNRITITFADRFLPDQIAVLNEMGEVLQKVKTNGIEDFTLNVSALAAGLYLIRASNSVKTETTVFQKE